MGCGSSVASAERSALIRNGKDVRPTAANRRSVASLMEKHRQLEQRQLEQLFDKQIPSRNGIIQRLSTTAVRNSVMEEVTTYADITPDGPSMELYDDRHSVTSIGKLSNTANGRSSSGMLFRDDSGNWSPAFCLQTLVLPSRHAPSDSTHPFHEPTPDVSFDSLQRARECPSMAEIPENCMPTPTIHLPPRAPPSDPGGNSPTWKDCGTPANSRDSFAFTETPSNVVRLSTMACRNSIAEEGTARWENAYVNCGGSEGAPSFELGESASRASLARLSTTAMQNASPKLATSRAQNPARWSPEKKPGLLSMGYKENLSNGTRESTPTTWRGWNTDDDRGSVSSGPSRSPSWSSSVPGSTKCTPMEADWWSTPGKPCIPHGR